MRTEYLLVQQDRRLGLPFPGNSKRKIVIYLNLPVPTLKEVNTMFKMNEVCSRKLGENQASLAIQHSKEDKGKEGKKMYSKTVYISIDD